MTKKEHLWIVGIDEVGRGPIAGPVTVCAFISEANFKVNSLFPNQIIRDSKKTKKHIRESINQSIRKLRKSSISKIDWVTVSKSAEYIDAKGVSKAIDFCIAKCISSLIKKGYKVESTKVYLDGGLKVKSIAIQQETVIKGDEKIGQIAIASILAKVSRDLYMKKLSREYPMYKWENNAGYGTSLHYEMIKQNSTTKYHRLSYLK